MCIWNLGRLLLELGFTTFKQKKNIKQECHIDTSVLSIIREDATQS